MRNHPTMFNAVYPVHKRPLVVRTNVDYEFTTITVDQVAAADGNYEVLFLGTGELITHLYIDGLLSYIVIFLDNQMCDSVNINFVHRSSRPRNAAVNSHCHLLFLIGFLFFSQTL